MKASSDAGQSALLQQHDVNACLAGAQEVQIRAQLPAAQAAACSASSSQTQAKLHAHVRFDPAVQLGPSATCKHSPDMPQSSSAAYPASTMCIDSGQIQRQQHFQDGCKAASGFEQAQPHCHWESQNQQKPHRLVSMDPQSQEHCSDAARLLSRSQAQPSTSDCGHDASALSVRPRKRHKAQDHTTAPVAGLVKLQQSARLSSLPAFPHTLHTKGIPSAPSVSAAAMLNQRPPSSSSVRGTDCTQGKHVTASRPAESFSGGGDKPSSHSAVPAASAANRRPRLPQTTRIGSVYGQYQQSLHGFHSPEMISKPSCTSSHEGGLKEGGMQQRAASPLTCHTGQRSNSHVAAAPSAASYSQVTSMHSGDEQPMPPASQQLHSIPGTSQAASKLPPLPTPWHQHQHDGSQSHRASAHVWHSRPCSQQQVGNHNILACSSGLPQASQPCVSQRAQADGTALGTLLEGSQRLQATAALAQVRFQSWHQYLDSRWEVFNSATQAQLIAQPHGICYYSCHLVLMFYR